MEPAGGGQITDLPEGDPVDGLGGGGRHAGGGVQSRLARQSG